MNKSEKVTVGDVLKTYSKSEGTSLEILEMEAKHPHSFNRRILESAAYVYDSMVGDKKTLATYLILRALKEGNDVSNS